MRLIARSMLTACFVLALGVAPALGAAASAGELTLDDEVGGGFAGGEEGLPIGLVDHGEESHAGQRSSGVG